MNFKDLLIWQNAMEISMSIYNITKNFPKEEVYGITSQLRRASVSVAANIAEGHGRNSTGEYKQFLGYAIGSLSELETLCILSSRLGYSPANWNSLIAQIEAERKMLCTVRKKLSARKIN